MHHVLANARREADIDLVEAAATSGMEVGMGCEGEAEEQGQEGATSGPADDEVESVDDEDDACAAALEPGVLDDMVVMMPTGDQVDEGVGEPFALSPELPVPSEFDGLGGAGPSSGAAGSCDPMPSSISPMAIDASRSRAGLVLFVPGGKVSYYPKKHVVECVCCNPLHGKCALTRTLSASNAPTRAAQGRPLGFAMAWLEKGMAASTKDDHWDPFMRPTRAERVHGRAALRATDAGRSLLALERPKRANEESEPDEDP
jgi:hypothetical protein